MISSRFSVAIHILSLIDMNEGKVTSDYIAGSVNTNAVVIRRIMSLLGKAGIIESHPGVTGMKLVRPLSDITFLDVYQAIELPENSGLFSIHQNPNPNCPVGRNIQAALEVPLLEAQRQLEQTLAETTVEQVVRSIQLKA
ncbi:Rrf2 family transcriptional regulator [Paenibacillus baekrokdamisoli]|uniref:Rrf2 family transcriptional regulator n=1 Tax=Paenibacillus baekrokdamisoli TaxID=1712516 RepID=A0A3G9JJ58_9BACL|nr:Rrf2 family transcriptional regulator [Paenibacillus baekrokdamisoli]MBB3071899.1 DNA-binding IscR family transcriptional regulator [Paenibacillus baekrokdamisoli]BBH24118.1 Rrf2 family transcriptional regulator [Paenibacillus baekrokdamisoli]